MDLHKLKHLEESSNLKVNERALARKLHVDRRTISKYINGYTKPASKPMKSQFDAYYSIIKELLQNTQKDFAYKRILWQYLKDNYNMLGAQSSFRRYLSSIEEFNQYFQEKRAVKSFSPMQYETAPGQLV